MFAYLGDRLGMRTKKSVIITTHERFTAADPLHLHKQAAIHAASQQAQDRSPHGGSGQQGGARMAQPERHTHPANSAVAGRARRSHAEQ